MKPVKRLGSIVAVAIATATIFSPQIIHAAPPKVTIQPNLTTEKINTQDRVKEWNAALGKYRFWVSGIGVVATATLLIVFMINILRIGASDSPMERTRTIKALIWTGFAAACIGGITVIGTLFFNALK